MIDQFAEIAFNDPVSQDTFLMGLNSPRIAVEAEPGQFVMIRAVEGYDPLLRRPFSICGIDREKKTLFVLYRVVGRGTSLMSGTQKGDQLRILGPLGKAFDLPENSEPALFVAGGVGAAPLIFAAQNRLNRNDVFITGYRSSPEIFSLEPFGVDLSLLLIATEDGSCGYHGTVTQLFESHISGCQGLIPPVFACGPVPMLKEIALRTLERGVPCWISLEVSMACGLGACQGCAVPVVGEDPPYLHACGDGPVFPAESIDWERL